VVVARRRNKPVTGESVRRCKALIFGPPGQGKTHLLGTAVFDERCTPFIIWDFEGEVLDTLGGLPGLGTDWHHERIRTYDDLNTQYERLRVNDEGFKAFALDSLSELHIWMLLQQLDDGKPSRTSEPDLIQQGDYGVALVQLRRLVRELKDLPLHSFYTAHSKEEAVAKEGLVTMPSMAGKAAYEIPGLMTLVGYLGLTEDDEGATIRSLLLQNYVKVRTKVRTPWGIEAPDEIDNPTITAVLDALKYDS
jgi:hypothetical protein